MLELHQNPGEMDDRNTIRTDLSVRILLDISDQLKLGIFTRDGAFVVDTGEFTGRSPKDKYIVEPDSVFVEKIDYGEVNNRMCRKDFERLHDDVASYIRRQVLYEQNLQVGADPANRRYVRLLTPSPWHAVFATNLFIEPSAEKKKILQKLPADITIVHAPEFFAEPDLHHTRSKTVIALDFDTGRVVIAGTSYAGEIKKSVFTYMQGVLPEEQIATMHCSATTDEQGEAVAIYFGLSGTGKTTLSQDAGRILVGDDEHAWSDGGVFNLEGGCYPKAINLDPEKEPEIYKATNRPGSILENVTVDEHGVPDFTDQSKTENTRSAFSIQEMNGWTGMAGHPKYVIFLTADASGVLPPVARLTAEQAMYYLLSGYTSKVAGTERGVTEPQPTFSTCFGAPFLPLHPSVYAELIGKKIAQHNPSVWLVNTGWSGEAHQNGNFDPKKRMSLSNITRPIVRAITSGTLDEVPTRPMPVFGVYVPTECPGVDPLLLRPETSWNDPAVYEERRRQLAQQFEQNFEKKFGSKVSLSIRRAGPRE